MTTFSPLTLPGSSTIAPFFAGLTAGVVSSLFVYFIRSKINCIKRSGKKFRMRTYIKDEWRIYEIPNEKHIWKTKASNIEQIHSDDSAIIKYKVPSDFTMSFVFH